MPLRTPSTGTTAIPATPEFTEASVTFLAAVGIKAEGAEDWGDVSS